MFLTPDVRVVVNAAVLVGCGLTMLYERLKQLTKKSQPPVPTMTHRSQNEYP